MSNQKIKNMKTRTVLFFITMLLLASQAMSGQATSAVTDVISSAISERNYTNTPVTDQQLETILRCGVKAPSAVNAQPWKFTVIKDESAMKEIIKDVVPGNVLIVVSGLAPQKEGAGTPDFDCGLAAENMFIAAHGLGLGARIYGSPARNINYNKEAYQIPEGYNAIVVLRVGNVGNGVDAVSSASPRKDYNEVVNFMK